MSTFGNYFRVTTYGESHCKGIGGVVDGVPPRMELTEEDIQPQLSRRRPGQNALTTKRNEGDVVTIMSGTEFGVTLGTPIGLAIPNKDQRPGDYKEMSDVPRPSHADFTYQMKYGTRASSGGGRSSARETAVRVAAGAIAEKWLGLMYGTEIVAYVESIGAVTADVASVNEDTLTREEVDAHIVRCPDHEAGDRMVEEIEAARDASDSTGGVVVCVIRGSPVGLGEPCFDKLEALLAHAMLSIPATKGFEIGSGFSGTSLRGSEHNDAFVAKDGRLGTTTNNSGGIQGGISNGETIRMRIAFKPPATIGQEQATASFGGDDSVLAAKGRHDPCVVPRALPIVEAMAALVIADAAMSQLAREAAAAPFPLRGTTAAPPPLAKVSPPEESIGPAQPAQPAAPVEATQTETAASGEQAE